MSEPSQSANAEPTPLHDLHRARGAKMVPFAGYALPVHYPPGIVAEHRHVRTRAGLFDVSHMGQIRITGPEAAAALETVLPADVAGLAPLQMRYTMLTTETGGILDDLTLISFGAHYVMIVNASRKAAVLAHLNATLLDRCNVEPLDGRALLALQGPLAEAVLVRHAPTCATLAFMTAARVRMRGVPCVVTRSGYTGEDGFEISLAAEAAVAVAELLLEAPEVAPAGLGARDSLRLEAGLCLYGQDIDETTTPIEAGLAWTIPKARRARADFVGAPTILAQLADGAPRRRVGIAPEGRAIARAHTPVRDVDGHPAGEVTSGGFGPSVDAPIAMGYVATALAKAGTPLGLVVRDVVRPARVAALPFVPHRYKRQP